MFDRDRILAEVDLASLADELLGPRNGNERSGTWACPIPNHAQTGRTPPLSVFRSRRGEQRWTCHGCGAAGTAIDLVMAVRGCDVREALALLAARAGVREHRALAPPRRPPPPVSVPSPTAQLGLDRYVNECAARLWRGDGAGVRRWLMAERALPADVLRHNRVGADPGPARQTRPPGVPRVAGAVLPVVEHGRAVFGQLRRIHPPRDRPRYLNLAASLAPNPRLARFEPPRPVPGCCTVVTEGSIDALSAAAAGWPAVAVLGAGLADEGVADRLARIPGRLVLAFDADPAGEVAAGRLRSLLADRGVAAARLHVPAVAGDLNAWMLEAGDWRTTMASALRSATRSCPGLGALARA